MFQSHPKSKSHEYTRTVALLAAGIGFSPAMYFALRQNALSLSLALVCSTACLLLAWVSWKKSAQLAVPSIVMQEAAK